MVAGVATRPIGGLAAYDQRLEAWLAKRNSSRPM
jgi:hypothetical protein